MSQVKLIVLIGIVALTVQTSNSASIHSENDCVCTREYLPICATNDVTYSNKCQFQCEKKRNSDLEIKSYGECEEENKGKDLPRVCLCRMVYEPVCGTDGHTYTSLCELLCEQRQKNDLRIKHSGVCRQEIEIPIEINHKCICTLEYMPLCGTNGHTFANQCELDCENKYSKTHIGVEHTGECIDEVEHLSLSIETDLVCACPLILLPVCGTDGRTYANECDLKCARTRIMGLEVRHQGECDLDYCVCTDDYRPLCGSDGITYGNQCGFRCAAKKRTDIRIVHSGECN